VVVTLEDVKAEDGGVRATLLLGVEGDDDDEEAAAGVPEGGGLRGSGEAAGW
jgi:hypothetical protein